MSESQINSLSRRSFLRFSATGVAVIGGGAVVSACGGGEAQSLSARVANGDPVRLAIANEPPYTVLNADGTLTGAAPDVAKEVLSRMGVGADQVEPRQTDYKTMIPGLKAGRWDIVTAGLFMNQDRCAQVSYSSPVIVSPESFAVPAGNPKGIETVGDVKSNPDIKVGVLQDSFELNAAKSVGISASQLSAYPLAPKALQAMAAGRVDAVLLPTQTLKKAKKDKGGKFEITPPLESFPTSGSGAAFRPSDKDFLADYNKELKALKKSEKFTQILDKWGFSAEAARKATTEQLCKNGS